MDPQLIGHPDRIVPFQHFLRVIAQLPGPVLISGPVGSGKKRTAQFLTDNGLPPSGPVARLDGFRFSADLWERTLIELRNGGTLQVSNLHRLHPSLQSRFLFWLRGEGSLYPEKPAPPLAARLLAFSTRPQELSDELLYQFPLHIRLPALNEVAEDIPYHLSVFLRDKPVRYVRYFFLLKTFFHQWEGNLLELSHYLDQALAYYQSMSSVAGFRGGEEVFGEKRLRFYQDILKGEWWYYPYRFRPAFTGSLQHILQRTDFRDRMIREDLVVPLMKEEPGYLVLDLKDAEFEKKANAIYTLFRKYLDDQTTADHEQKGG